MPLNVGDRLGHYDVTAPLGEGGMGQVYRARDTKLDAASRPLAPFRAELLRSICTGPPSAVQFVPH